MAEVAKKIVFSGAVQGVGFRYTSCRTACRYDLKGFVRNMADGTVEMFLQGAGDEVEYCLEDIKQSFSGYIRNVDVKDVGVDKGLVDFQITF